MKRLTRRQFLPVSVMAGAWVAAADDRCAWPAGLAHDHRTVGPFVCRADFSLARHEPLLRQLRRLQTDVCQALSVAPSAERIELYLFRDRHEYRAFLNTEFPRVPYRRALYVKASGPGKVMAYRHREMDTDVRHECTHALLHATLDVVPLWLDEGIAEYYEVSAPDRAGNHPHLKWVRWTVLLGRILSLEALETRRELDEMKSREYRSAWAWVHFMLHGSPAAHRELRRFFRDIQAGHAPGLLSERLRRAVPDADRQLAHHFRTWRA